MGKDITDNMSSDQELLNILNGVDSNDSGMKSAEEALSQEDDEKEGENKIKELKALASSITSSPSGSNPGSGDIDLDLSLWFEGSDKLPSDELTDYVSNSSVKMDYGLHRNVISSFSLMGKLRKFLENDAFDVVFSSQSLLGCDPEEVLDRVRIAFTMYERLANINAKVIKDMKDYKVKSNIEETEIDKLSLLLSTIPSDKLSKVLEDIAYSSEEV